MSEIKATCPSPNECVFPNCGCHPSQIVTDNEDLIKAKAYDMNKKESAAIQLRLPMSGNKALNKMIMVAQKRDVALNIMTAMIATHTSYASDEDLIAKSIRLMEKFINGIHAHNLTYRTNQPPKEDVD